MCQTRESIFLCSANLKQNYDDLFRLSVANLVINHVYKHREPLYHRVYGKESMARFGISERCLASNQSKMLTAINHFLRSIESNSRMAGPA